VNVDDPLAMRASQGVASRRIGFSRRPAAARGRVRGRHALVVQLPGRSRERYPARCPGSSARHNQANALAALLASRLAGATPPRRGRAARVPPLAHRMELVADAGGIAYYDDSKGPTSARSSRRWTASRARSC
jgi:UDP-N-acetylmuramoylalanine--D-glutamate ligase